MILAVFGATGRTGRPLVEQALAAGHTVVVGARAPQKLGLSHERLHVVQGDTADAAHVARVVGGADLGTTVDAVALGLGPTKSSPPRFMETAARNVVVAMREHGVRRVVSVSGAAVRDPQDEPGLGPAITRGIMSVVAKSLLEDSQAHVETLRASGLDWTVVRGPRLTEGDPTGRYRLGFFAMAPSHSIARADVATAMLHLIERPEYVGQAPVITGNV